MFFRCIKYKITKEISNADTRFHSLVETDIPVNLKWLKNLHHDYKFKRIGQIICLFFQVRAKFTVDDYSHYFFTPCILTQWVLGLFRYDLEGGKFCFYDFKSLIFL